MKLSTTVICLLFTSVLLIIFSTWTMQLEFPVGECKETTVQSASVKTTTQNPLFARLAHLVEHQYHYDVLFPLLYDQLDAMPRELIQIIFEYYLYELQGILEKTMSIPETVIIIDNQKHYCISHVKFLVPLSERRIALCLFSKELQVIDLGTGKFMRMVKDPQQNPVSLCAPLPDRLVAVTDFGLLLGWDSEKGNTLYETKTSDPRHYKYTYDLLSLPEHHCALGQTREGMSSLNDNVIKIFNADTGKFVRQIDPHIIMVHMSLLHHTLVVSGYKEGITFWDWKTGDREQTAIKWHKLDFGNAQYIMPLSEQCFITIQIKTVTDKTKIKKTNTIHIWFWRYDTKELLGQLDIKCNGDITDIKTLPYNKLLVTSRTGMIIQYDLLSGVLIKNFRAHQKENAMVLTSNGLKYTMQQAIACSVILPGGEMVTAGKNDGTLKRWS